MESKRYSTVCFHFQQSAEKALKEKQIEIKERISVDFYLDNTRFSDEFLVSDEISEEVIIGAGTMQRWRFRLGFENEKVIFNPEVTNLILI